jgi:predicted NBD/HSP70 family sugar kinase
MSAVGVHCPNEPGFQVPKSEDADRLPSHGSRELPRVIVDGYGEDVRTKDGYFGELVSKGAFKKLLADLRGELAEGGGDPIEDEPEDITRGRVDKLLKEGDAAKAGVILTVVEQFAQNIADVVTALFKLKSWRGVERIVVGGGVSDSRVGELSIGRANVIMRERGQGVDMQPIRHHPDEAGILGAAQLFPAKTLRNYEHMLGVDIGGSNFRCGLIALNQDQDKTLRRAQVLGHEIWRHADEKEASLDICMERLAAMLRASLKFGEKQSLKLSPLLGVGVPGTVLEDGGLEGGVLNLPGDWKTPAFNLPSRLRQMIPEIGGEPTQIVVHNDAVVQGLAEAPFMTDVERWGVLTVGTGLGNAVFRNKEIKRK